MGEYSKVIWFYRNVSLRNSLCWSICNINLADTTKRSYKAVYVSWKQGEWMTFNLFSTTRKKRSLMYGRVARPIQKSFFKFCEDFFKAEWITFPIMLSHSFYFFSVFRRYQAISSHFIRSSTSYKLLLNIYHWENLIDQVVGKGYYVPARGYSL